MQESNKFAFIVNSYDVDKNYKVNMVLGNKASVIVGSGGGPAPSGSSMGLPWSSFLNNNNLAGLVSDVYYMNNNNNFLVAGQAGSLNFPVSNGQFTYDPSHGVDAFVLKFGQYRKILWGSYFGGSAYDAATKVIANSDDYVYLAGVTMSSDINICTGCNPTDPRLADDTYNGGDCDIFIARFDPDGLILNSSNISDLFITYFGGSGNECVTSLAIDSYDNIYIGGIVYAASYSDFPIEQRSGAYFRDFDDGMVDNGSEIGFLMRITENNEIDWCTAFGGDRPDRIMDLEIDNEDNLVIFGWTRTYGPATVPSSAQISNVDDFFPLVEPGGSSFFRNHSAASNGGDPDNFISKLNTDGEITWSTMFGGVNAEQGYIFSVIGNMLFTQKQGGMEITSNNRIVISGTTYSSVSGNHPYFPIEVISTDPGYFNASYQGSGDGFIAMFDNSSLALLWSTYFGGSSLDWVSDIASGKYESWIYITGYTASSDFQPILNPGNYFYQGGLNTNGSAMDIYLIRFSGSGILDYGSYFGGDSPNGEWPQGIDCDGVGSHVIIAGNSTSNSLSFPLANIYANLPYNTYFYAQPQQGTLIPFVADFQFLCDPCARLAMLSSSIENSSNNMIYPNPVYKYFYLKDKDVLQVDILDYSGKLVRNLNQPELPILIEDLAAGLYFVKITNKNHSVSNFKLVISK